QDEKEIKQQISSLGESQSDGVVVVFSDVDFIHDQFAYKRNLFGLSLANDNATLLLNTLEAVSGDKDLLTVRSKGRFTRSFDVIDQIEFSAEKRTQQKVSQINQSIRRFEAELNDLGKNANNENVALLRNEGINKKKDLAKKITELKRELREVKRKGREQIEILGKRLQYANTLLVPFLLIIFGIYFNRKRKKQ
ncbi:MAG: hypothetical protein KDD50_13040, partial [Bdellovibrionales bacterium]|nr:hypothetical protein [Bdellovibrionales bacterium]